MLARTTARACAAPRWSNSRDGTAAANMSPSNRRISRPPSLVPNRPHAEHSWLSRAAEHCATTTPRDLDLSRARTAQHSTRLRLLVLDESAVPIRARTPIRRTRRPSRPVPLRCVYQDPTATALPPQRRLPSWCALPKATLPPADTRSKPPHRSRANGRAPPLFEPADWAAPAVLSRGLAPAIIEALCYRLAASGLGDVLPRHKMQVCVAPGEHGFFPGMPLSWFPWPLVTLVLLT